ncbi:hypothetical protein [Paenibacillus sp. FSL W8-0194]|uniref:hypothetical protein n=1 Tax=Paenibacillus sp. FSL W8-0194 TaxID=2921711 RepID=UPI0030DC8098
MMNKSFKVTVAASMLSLVVAIPTFASDQQDQQISGGWSESMGYYVNSSDSVKTDSIGVFAGTTPDSHTGKRLTHVMPGGDNEYAAYGETKWQGVYHYTTAQMELSNGTVKTTSGRQYGYNQTSAQSPWYLPKSLFENTEARTYWGT